MSGYDYRAAREAIFASSLSTAEKCLLLALVEFAPKIRPSHQTLGLMTSMEWRSIIRVVKRLEKAGALMVRRHPGNVSEYEIGTLAPLTEGHPCPTVTPDPECTNPCPTVTPPLTECHPTPDPRSHEADQTIRRSEADHSARADAPSEGGDPWGLTPEPEPAKPKRPRATKPKPPADPSAHTRVTDGYFVAFELARGCKPTFDGADGTAVKRLLSKVKGDPDRALRIIDAAYSDPYLSRSATIRTIASDPAKYETAKPRTNGRAPVKPQGSSDDLARIEAQNAKLRAIRGGKAS